MPRLKNKRSRAWFIGVLLGSSLMGFFLLSLRSSLQVLADSMICSWRCVDGAPDQCCLVPRRFVQVLHTLSSRKPAAHQPSLRLAEVDESSTSFTGNGGFTLTRDSVKLTPNDPWLGDSSSCCALRGVRRRSEADVGLTSGRYERRE